MQGVRSIAILALLVTACGLSDTLTIEGSAPFSYAAPSDPTVERVAIVVSITSRSEDDLLVNPTDLWARDRDGRIYLANVAAASTDARLVRTAGVQLGLSGLLPLPAATLRKNDVLVGYLVFDVPSGVRPTHLVFRETDADHVIELAPPSDPAR